MFSSSYLQGRVLVLRMVLSESINMIYCTTKSKPLPYVWRYPTPMMIGGTTLLATIIFVRTLYQKLLVPHMFHRPPLHINIFSPTSFISIEESCNPMFTCSKSLVFVIVADHFESTNMMVDQLLISPLIIVFGG